MIGVNGVDLCVDTLGQPSDPAVLLMSGAASSMDWWEDEFCRELADGRRFVIRYDNRDTGQSVSYPPGAPSYTIADLEADAVAILDALGVPTAHLVGMSMGGIVAQRVAVNHPDRVDTLTLISTSPGPGRSRGSDLPPIDDSILAHLGSEHPAPDWSDRTAVIAYYVRGQRPLGPPGHVDEDQLATVAGRVFDRSRDMATAANHFCLDGIPHEGEEPVRDRLGEITAPTLVVHGTADPFFRLGHAEALVREIPGARLMTLEGCGHQMPPPRVWPQLVPALLRHTSGSWDDQAGRLATTSVAAGDPTGWFETLYAEARSGRVDLPWDRSDPMPLLVRWLESSSLDAVGSRAVVVGCGLGADAEYLATRGFDTVGFDVSETAVSVATERHRGSGVEYVVADLFDLPTTWEHAFDLVVEIYTVQALPDNVRPAAIRGVASLVATGGTLVVVAFASLPGLAEDSGPPWPLTRHEVDSFATDGLTRAGVELVADRDRPGVTRWVAEFTRPR